MAQEESDAIWMRLSMFLAEIIQKDPERFRSCFERVEATKSA